MNHLQLLLLAVLACGASDPTRENLDQAKSSPLARTPDTPTVAHAAGDALVAVPQGWDCSQEQFQPSELMLASTGGAVIRPGEAGHRLICFLEGTKTAGAAYVFRYTIGDSMPMKERFQADLDETYKSPITFTTEKTSIGSPIANELSGCGGLQVEHQVIAFDEVSYRRQFLCKRNGVAYNIIVSGTDGKAWTEAQSILNSLTFK